MFHNLIRFVNIRYFLYTKSEMFFLIVLGLELFLLYFLYQLLLKSLSRIVFKITKSKNITVNIFFLFFLPGVIIHELSHYLVANLLFVRTGEIKFVPEITEDGIRLGSVGIERTDPIRRAIIGFAPVLIGLSVLLMLANYLTQNFIVFMNIKLADLGGIFLLIYILFVIGNTMFSSQKDLEGTIELLIVIAIISFALYISGFRMPLEWIGSLLNRGAEEFIKKINLLILIPIGIDSILYLLSSFLLRK